MLHVTQRVRTISPLVFNPRVMALHRLERDRTTHVRTIIQTIDGKSDSTFIGLRK